MPAESDEEESEGSDFSEYDDDSEDEGEEDDEDDEPDPRTAEEIARDQHIEQLLKAERGADVVCRRRAALRRIYDDGADARRAARDGALRTVLVE